MISPAASTRAARRASVKSIKASNPSTSAGRDGKRLTTDGPFAETKEQLGGFYMIDAKDLDEAIHIAGKIPAARFGCVEVRPIMKFD